MARVHVLIRLVLLAALSMIGCSSVYWILYLALPGLVALLVAQRGATRYLAEDAPRVARVLRWLAAAYAYLWLLTDAVPSQGDVAGPVDLVIEPGGAPTPVSAVARIVSSIPALILFALLSIGAALCWLVAAVAVLIRRRVPHAIAGFMAQVLSYQLQLFAYHVSLVEAYPSLEGAADVRHASV
jgi:hypothetical protein